MRCDRCHLRLEPGAHACPVPRYTAPEARRPYDWAEEPPYVEPR